jgi:hypothetical protein
MRSGLGPYMVEYVYIIGFLSVALICLGVCNTGRSRRKEPLRNRVERVATYLFHNFALARGYAEAEEVLYDSEVGCLHDFGENPLPYSGLVGDKKSLLESILFCRYVVLAEVLLQYRSF